MATPPSSERASADAAPASVTSGDPSPDAPARPPTELAKLREALYGDGEHPGIVHVLPRLQRSHKKELVRVEQWTTGELARHPEPRELIRSRRRPGNIDEKGRLLHVFDARRVLIEDVHENRVIKHVLFDIQARLRRLVAAGQTDAVAPLAALDGAIASCPFLLDVSALRARPTEPTQTLARDPLYRSIFQSWLALDR